MGPAAKNTTGPGYAAEPINRPASLDIGSVLPSDVRQRLDESAAMRREMDMQASLRLAPAAPKSMAERRRTAAKFSKIAAALREAGKLTESLHPLQQAIAANPDDAELHFDLGLTLIRCLRHPDAVAPLQRATELKPGFAKAHYTFALACEAVGRNLEAIAALRRATEYAPKLMDAHMMLGTLLHRCERLEEAQESFRRAAVAGRNTTIGRIAESFVLSESGKLAEAAEVLRQALKRDPTNDMAHTALGHVLSNMGDLDGATAQFERTPKLLGDQIAIWAALLQIKKITEADGRLVTAMETHLRRERLVPRHKMTLHFTLGKHMMICGIMLRRSSITMRRTAYAGSFIRLTARGSATKSTPRSNNTVLASSSNTLAMDLKTRHRFWCSACRGRAPRWSSRSCRATRVSRQPAN